MLFQDRLKIIKQYHETRNEYIQKGNPEANQALAKIESENQWIMGFDVVGFLLDEVDLLQTIRENQIEMIKKYHQQNKDMEVFIHHVSRQTQIWFDENGVKQEGPTSIAMRAQGFAKAGFKWQK